MLLLTPLVAMLAACAAVPAPTSSARVFVIRHFEKESGRDPALTGAGEANARRLAERMSGERVVAVFSTDTKRTRATAVRTAERYGLPVSLYPPTDYTALVQRVVEQRGNVLIVGHSNTVPEIVGQLSGKAQPPMDESRYGDLFVIDLATREVSAERIGD